MSPNLEFEVGERSKVRGRAVFCIPQQNHPTAYKIIDIDGTALKEAIYAEILGGRLVLLDLFEPFYVKIRDLEKNLTHEQIIEFCHKELRDLVSPQLLAAEEQINPEVLQEQLVSKYTTLYREETYLRVLRQLEDELFHLRKRTRQQFYYTELFKLASGILYFLRARREDATTPITTIKESLDRLQQRLPILDIQKIGRTLQRGIPGEWYEMANYIDALFLTLKNHYPLAFGNGNYLDAREEKRAWLAEGVLVLWEEYFVALLSEEYERAQELKCQIEDYNTSQSLEGRSNS